jgi:hypothetical protein
MRARRVLDNPDTLVALRRQDRVSESCRDDGMVEDRELGATAVQLPDGTTGESSMPTTASGNSRHSPASTALTRRGSHPEG